MADFVGDAGTGGAVIRGGVAVAVEVGRLQQAGRESFGVGGEDDDRADNLRIDSPLVRVGRLCKVGEIAHAIEGFRAAHVAEGIAAHDIERRIVDPFIGIAEANPESGQLG